MYNREYLWTDHAWKRLKERKIPEHYLTATLTSPDKIDKPDDFTKKLQKKFGVQTVTFIIKKNYRGENILVSCWIDPPMQGTRDARKRKRYVQARKAKGIGKIWFAMLYMLGI